MEMYDRGSIILLNVKVVTMLSLIIWLLFGMLLFLNVLDYTTTAAALSRLRDLGDVWQEAPLWKCTRLGRALVKAGVVSPPIVKKVEWWEHELNPAGQFMLRKWDIRSLAYMKVVAMGLFGLSLAIQTICGVPFLPVTAYTIGGLVILYELVVINNLKVVKKCQSVQSVEVKF